MRSAVLVVVTACGCGGDSQPSAPARSRDDAVAGLPTATLAEVQAVVHEYLSAYEIQVLDGIGIIRHKDLRGQELEDAVESLVRQPENPR